MNWGAEVSSSGGALCLVIRHLIEVWSILKKGTKAAKTEKTNMTLDDANFEAETEC